MLLPVGRLHHFFDTGPFGLAQQGEHALLLGHSRDLWLVNFHPRLGGGDSLSLRFNRSRRSLGVGSRRRDLTPRNVDVVVVVGGEAGAKGIAEIAQALEKIIIPMPAFGGLSEPLWDKLRGLIERDRPSGTDALTDYFGHVSKTRATEVVKITEDVQKARRDAVRLGYPLLLAVQLIWSPVKIAV